ncbi:MAG: hypothetical protein M3R36_05960 [Bacteroidota bacterium]|nr:hypothetical protein [Bacteroidota bacterium]
MLVSFQDRIINTENLRQNELDEILNNIRTGKYKTDIERLRKIRDKEKVNEFKRTNLPYFVPATFKTGKRKIIDFDSTALVLFDIDEKQFENSEICLDTLRELLKIDETVYSFFISPSGKGLKVLYKLDKIITGAELFSKLYMHYGNWFKEKYKISIDTSCKDVSRACFLSYDSQLFLNENAVHLSTKIKLPDTYSLNGHSNHYHGYIESDNATLLNGIISWFENKKSLRYEDGNKYNYLITICGACNSFGVDKEFLKQTLINNYQNRPNIELVKSRDFEDIVDKVYTTYLNQFNTKHFIRGNIQETFSSLNIDTEFWYYDKEKKINLSREKFLKFLQINGYGKMYYGKDYLFIRIIDNIIYEVDENRIKDFVLNYAMNININGLREQLLRSCNIYFGENFLSSIETIEPKIKRDTSNEAYY